MVFNPSDMSYSIVIDLQMGFDVNHSTVLHLGDFLQLEVPKPTTIRLDLNVMVSCVEVTLFETILDCQEL